MTLVFDSSNYIPTDRLKGIIKPDSPFAVVQSNSVGAMIALIFQIVIAVAAVGFLLMLIISGVRYLTGAGNEEATKAAKAGLLSAVIGLLIVLAAYGMGRWILSALGVVK